MPFTQDSSIKYTQQQYTSATSAQNNKLRHETTRTDGRTDLSPARTVSHGTDSDSTGHAAPPLYGSRVTGRDRDTVQLLRSASSAHVQTPHAPQTPNALKTSNSP